jgi:DNA-directed RNA polymerase subunit alpha
MSTTKIILPSKPRLVSEEGNKGVYEVDNLNPGFGHTLGNSLRRIILSSLEGAAITSLKIDGVEHEFDTLEGVKEDVLHLILHLKLVRFKLLTDEPQKVELSVKGAKVVTAKDIQAVGQVEVLNEDQYICEITDAKTTLNIELTIEKGIGYMSREALQKEKVDIGTIAIDAAFSPVRRVAYEVEDMRVGDRTDHNRLRMIIETDGTYSPREAFEKAVEILILQLQSIHDFKGLDEKPEEIAEEMEKEIEADRVKEEPEEQSEEDIDKQQEMLKTRIEDLNLSTRTMNALANAKIRTVGGIARKREEDLLAVDGMGEKGIQEIRRALSNFGILLK